jgi:hypothetical protein
LSRWIDERSHTDFILAVARKTALRWRVRFWHNQRQFQPGTDVNAPIETVHDRGIAFADWNRTVVPDRSSFTESFTEGPVSVGGKRSGTLPLLFAVDAVLPSEG